MVRLYLLRHAKSSWDDPTLPDRDRPLSSRGRRTADLAARYIEMENIAPDLVLCSPARRCQETLELIRDALGSEAHIRTEEPLYGIGSDELLRRLRKVPRGVTSVMVIGHNPTIQELALMLARGSGDLHQLQAKFPTAAMATLESDGDWKHLGAAPATLEEFVVPREEPGD